MTARLSSQAALTAMENAFCCAFDVGPDQVSATVIGMDASQAQAVAAGAIRAAGGDVASVSAAPDSTDDGGPACCVVTVLTEG